MRNLLKLYSTVAGLRRSPIQLLPTLAQVIGTRNKGQFILRPRLRPHIDDYGIFQINLILISPANVQCARTEKRIVYCTICTVSIHMSVL